MKFLQTGSIYSLFIFILFSSSISAQVDSVNNNKTEIQLAHDSRGKIEDFMNSDNNIFKVRVYSIKTPITNTVHHWFVQILNEKLEYINYGRLSIDAYHQSNKNSKLNYMNPVFAMCQEGKYVVSFINVKKSGTWIIDATIVDHYGISDTISLEMEVAEK